ncbi:MAG: hypothetical protein M1815_002331 [Lichina confinis]|nr:MAG: hypothetical protein M1815_002331 [Lichina confinis]
MIPPVPDIRDYGISPSHGFLPAQPPLLMLPHDYYSRWEIIIANLQGLLLSKRLRGVVDALPVLSTTHLHDESEWQRAYSVLGFISHAYIWGGETPIDRLPPSLTIPFLSVSGHLGLPPVATYAGVCLWNYKPLFPDEPVDNLENLSTLTTFTGALDESWFYLVSVAIEARGGPIIPMMLTAIDAARHNDSPAVTSCLQFLAQRIDDLAFLLQRMYENCDPHIFYHRVRPFLSGSKNMADAGLPNGVIYDDGTGGDGYRQYSGGSNAQSSLIQFLDIVLGVEHRPTGQKRSEPAKGEGGTAPPTQHNFIKDMRQYMPAPHRRFLEHMTAVANIRDYVEARRWDRGLCIAFDACLVMLRAFRDKHIQMVSRFIIVKSRESRSPVAESARLSASPSLTKELALVARKSTSQSPSAVIDGRAPVGDGKKKLRGTGGTALIPFLKQARDETGEPAIDAWARRLLGNGPAGVSRFSGGEQIVGLAGTWTMDDSEGGLCHW